MSKPNHGIKKPSRPLSFVVEHKDTLLPFLLKQVKGKSRNTVKNLLSKKQVQIDGKVVSQFDHPLQPGQTISIAPIQVKAEPSLPFDLLYEDDDIIVIDKPAGLLSIATEKEKYRTAYHIVTDYIKEKNKQNRIFIIHRLDKDTSGVLMFAKNEDAKRAFQDNWDDIVKVRRYLAVVEGIPQEASGTIRSFLLETVTHLVYSSSDKTGKEAVTHYRTIKSGGDYALLDVQIDTGRKNQIRVHMKDIGHPVTGDKKYGASQNPMRRLGLHACELKLTHPETGQELCFKAKTPKEFKRMFSVSGPSGSPK